MSINDCMLDKIFTVKECGYQEKFIKRMEKWKSSLLEEPQNKGNSMKSPFCERDNCRFIYSDISNSTLNTDISIIERDNVTTVLNEAIEICMPFFFIFFLFYYYN